jgi:rhodanese-related sulfurtransferase
MNEYLPGLGEIGPHTLAEWLRDRKATLIDIREPHEHAAERIAGGTLVPLSGFPAGLPAGPKPETAVFYCRSGNRTGKNAALLCAAGYARTYHLVGGILGWKEAGLPVETD